MLELISRDGLNKELEKKENKIYLLSSLDELETLINNGFIDKDGEVIFYNEEDYYAIEEDENFDLSDYYTKEEIDAQYNELFYYVSNGKILIAAAITDKGIETAATDTFLTMAENIGKIKGNDGASKEATLNLISPYIPIKVDKEKVSNIMNGTETSYYRVIWVDEININLLEDTEIKGGN